MSDVWILVRANLGRSVRRQNALLALLALLVAILLAVSAVIGAGLSYYARVMRTDSSLTLIEVSSAAPSAKRVVDDAAVAEMLALPSVTEVYPWFQADLGLADAATWPDAAVSPNPMWATPYVPGLAPKVIAGEVPASGPSDGEIILPNSVPGGSLSHLLGREVDMEYMKQVAQGVGEPAVVRLRVVGIADNSIPDRAGPFPAYVAGSQLARIVAASGTRTDSVIPTAFVRVDAPENVAGVQAELAGRGFAVNSLASQMPSLGGLFELLASSQTVMSVLLVLAALAVGGSLGASWVTARRREIGLLKALGWGSRRIALAVTLEHAALGLGVAVAGIALGCVISLVATTWVAAARLDVLPVDPWGLPPWGTILLSLLAVPVCICLGGLSASLRSARVDPDVALRDL